MKTVETRREFLKQIGAAVAIVALPSIKLEAVSRPQPSPELCEAFADLIALFDGAGFERQLEIIRAFEIADFGAKKPNDEEALKRFFNSIADRLRKRQAKYFGQIH